VPPHHDKKASSEGCWPHHDARRGGARAMTEIKDTSLRTIRSRWTDAVLWEGPAETVKDAIHAACAAGANLAGANLQRADLTGADLADADLWGADLAGADLWGANLRRADLTGADLTGADLTRADLTGADLTSIRDDIWAILSGSPAEVPTLLEKIRAGQIDGSCYEGACACLVGTLANARQCDYYDIATIAPNSRRPAEVFFATISVGDTPETSQSAKLAEGWIADWLDRMRAAFAGVQS
jgi:hypothetical protein